MVLGSSGGTPEPSPLAVKIPLWIGGSAWVCPGGSLTRAENTILSWDIWNGTAALEVAPEPTKPNERTEMAMAIPRAGRHRRLFLRRTEGAGGGVPPAPTRGHARRGRVGEGCAGSGRRS